MGGNINKARKDSGRGQELLRMGLGPCPLWVGLAAILPPLLALLFLIPPFGEQINHSNKSILEPGPPKAKLKPFLSRDGKNSLSQGLLNRKQWDNLSIFLGFHA